MMIKIKRIAKEKNKYKVEMTLTLGAILAIRNALNTAVANGSAVSEDVLGFLNMAGEQAGLEYFV